MGENYSCGSGGIIAAGRFVANAGAALMGDSLTADSYGLTNFYVINGANGGRMKLRANCGVASEGVGNMLSRVNNLYTDVNPGMAGLGPLGRIFVRAGTNNARSNISISSLAADYTSLLNALTTYAPRVIILAVPPLAVTANNDTAATYNSWLSAFAAATPAKFKYIDDCINVRNVDGTINASFFNVDGVHFNHLGVGQCGDDAAAAMASELANYPSPLSTDAADVYPAQPQWFINPTMAGSAGSAGGGFTGPVVNGLSVGAYGNGMAGVCSIVPADVGDPNQTPWQRVAITTGTAGSSLQFYAVPTGRAKTSVDPAQLDVMLECRLNSLDVSKIASISSMIQANTGEYLSPPMQIDLLASGIVSKKYVVRASRKRDGASTPTSAGWYSYVICRADFGPAANIGTIDVRSLTIRG